MIETLRETERHLLAGPWSVYQLAAELNRSVKQVRRYLADLESHGVLIEREDAHGQPTLYRIVKRSSRLFHSHPST